MVPVTASGGTHVFTGLQLGLQVAVRLRPAATSPGLALMVAVSVSLSVDCIVGEAVQVAVPDGLALAWLLLLLHVGGSMQVRVGEWLPDAE